MRIAITVFLLSMTAGTLAEHQPRAVSPDFARKEYLRIGISPLSAGMKVGESRRYHAWYVNGRDVVPASPRWRVSDGKILAVDNAGNVSAKTSGSAKVTVTDGVTSATANIIVR